jgi:hypothetical protein
MKRELARPLAGALGSALVDQLQKNPYKEIDHCGGRLDQVNHDGRRVPLKDLRRLALCPAGSTRTKFARSRAKMIYNWLI